MRLKSPFELFRPDNKTPVPYAPRRDININSSWMLNVDKTAQLETYHLNSTLYSVVSTLATATSQVPFTLWRKASKPEDRSPVERPNQVLRLFQNPNPFYTFQELIETAQQHVELTGEGWFVVQYLEGTRIPEQLWVVRPDRMQVVPSADDFIAGYIYHGFDGEKIPLSREDVILIRDPDPMNPYRGSSPLRALMPTIEGEHLAELYSRNFFRNGAEPGGLIEVEGNLSDEEFERMLKRWNEQHKGVSNAHRVAILEKARWKDRKYTNQDMQFSELRNLSRELILEAYAFPKAMSGNVNDVNRANAEAGEYKFSKWNLVPRLERIKSALNNDLLPLFGTAASRLEFDYDSPVMEDINAKANAVKTLTDAGYDHEDVLAVAGLPPMRRTTAQLGGNNEQEPASD